MINVPLSFHQKAQGQVIEPKSRVMVSFEKNSSLIGGDTEFLGSSSQETYSGKNLYIGSPSFSGYVNMSAWVDGGTYNGMPVIKKAGSWGGAFKLVNIVAGKTYTFSAWIKSDQARAVTIYSAGGSSGATATISPSNKSITTPTDWERVSFTFTCSASGSIALRFENTSSSTTNYTYLSGYQLEEGSSATDYQQYLGGVPSPNPEYPQEITTTTIVNYELCKIGDHQDKIYKENNVWYIHKEIGKAVLNGSEQGWYADTAGGYFRANIPLSGMANNTGRMSTGLLSDHFTPSTVNGIGAMLRNQGNLITYPQSSITALAGFKTWLASNNVTVYYWLETPTTNPITDQATLAFLEAQDVGYFTLDQSLLDGTSLLGSSEDNPIQLWDTYDYTDYTDRLVSVDMEHSFEFPYSVQSAIADFVFENTDNYFTPTRGSVIDEYNLPRRPIKIYAGFANETVVPQFVGITEGMVDIDEKKAVAKYTALDFLTEIAELTLDSTIAMRNVRTNEVLAKIVEQFGVLPSQYNFENGDNIIPFVFFDKGQNAGEAIRKLVQAEAGRFWLDEMGILRFQKRYTVTQQPMITLPEYSIISAKPSGANKIINHINITCDLREVQEYQTVYTKKGTGDSTSNLWVVDAGATITRQCSLEDPCYDVQLPTLGHATSVSWFTAKTAGGEEVTEGITTTGELSTNAYTVTFTNSNDFAVEIDEIELWGEPAKVYDVLEYDSYDDESVEKYGEQLLEINDNQFFQSFNQAQNFAVYTLSERANYNANLDLTIKGDFSLQLGDYIEIEGDYAGAYVIDSIKWHLGVGNLETTLKVHKYNPVEYFTLDVSRLDGTDVLA